MKPRPMKYRKVVKPIFYLLLLYLLSIAIRANNIHYKWQVEKQTVSKGNYSQTYPIKYLYYKDQKALVKDKDGVFMVDRSRKSNYSKGDEVFYSPIAIGLASLRQLQKANEYGDKKALESFLINAGWLIDNQDSLGRIPFPVKLKTLDKELTPPWYSALTQGFALSVFSRAFQISNDSSYYRGAKNALRPFEIPLDKGGIQSNNQDFGLFLEEYPTDPPTHVLNGFNYALMGLYDAATLLQIQDAQRLFDIYANELESKIHEFDLENWSAYSKDQPRLTNHYTYCNPWYHKLHIVQLEVLSEATGSKEFMEYSNNFREDLTGIVPFILYPAYVMYSDLVWALNLFK